MSKKTIAFQGAPGAYSDLACRAVFPDDETLPCLAFEDVFAAVVEKRADLAMLPIENSIAGRVADVHTLLPTGQLHIVAEHFQPIVHHLLAIPGAQLKNIWKAHSHVQALAQCRLWLRQHNIQAVVKGDTAGSAAALAKTPEPDVAVIASELAGKIYGLQSLAADIADIKGNTTRFLVLSRQEKIPAYEQGKIFVTTLVFKVRSVPAALYKALGGFATNGINMTKLESYLVGNFSAAQFYLDIEAHPAEERFKHAMDELKFFAESVTVLGTYAGHAERQRQSQDG
ncbi:MAG: prephenate dehydratase [Alphaproteobacteria bacterium]|nr:prephenate dehydratase [Alphaproteobacteria bacterium]NDC55802.1 prephenate dehydratase [Alphaproteobacteria bacterium]NDG03812.1 prephenate dehydratase [Alphaproteobacteria bacterium]